MAGTGDGDVAGDKGEVMVAVSGYTLDLYCDGDNDKHSWNEFPHEYLDSERGSVCRRMAREDGWVIRSDEAFCPKCKKIGRHR